MSFDEVIAKHTRRQLQIWNAWFLLDMNNPSRADYYTMQAAAVQCKNPPELDKLRIKFRPKGEASSMTREQAAAYSKMKWLGALGNIPIKNDPRNK